MLLEFFLCILQNMAPTGIAASPTRQLEIAKRATEFASIYQQLQDNQAAGLRVRLSTTDNGIAPLPLPLAAVRLQCPPPTMPLPAFLGINPKAQRQSFIVGSDIQAAGSVQAAPVSRFSKCRNKAKGKQTIEQKQASKDVARIRKQRSRLQRAASSAVDGIDAAAIHEMRP